MGCPCDGQCGGEVFWGNAVALQVMGGHSWHSTGFCCLFSGGFFHHEIAFWKFAPGWAADGVNSISFKT